MITNIQTYVQLQQINVGPLEPADCESCNLERASVALDVNGQIPVTYKLHCRIVFDIFLVVFD